MLSIFPYRPGAKRLLASKAGYGFLMPEDDAVTNRKAGKPVLTVEGNGALACLEARGDQVAMVGDNGKALIFPLAELPEMPKGKGVKLQSFREGLLRDVMVFSSADGGAWIDKGGRTIAWPDWTQWIGKRAGAGRLVPKGVPASKRFSPR